MQFPPSLVAPSPSHVCCLCKSLYVLKQEYHQWYARLSYALNTRGFMYSLNDYSLSSKHTGSQLLFLLSMLTTSCSLVITCKKLKKSSYFYIPSFTLKICREAHFFGMELILEYTGILITHCKFSIGTLIEFNCLESRSVSTPLDPTIKFSQCCGPPLPNSLVY